jgi:hypothetical protein
MKNIVTITIIFISTLCFGQTKNSWSEKTTYLIDSSDIWTADVFGNIYITKKEVIEKYDSIGNFKFSQSQKSIGRLSSIQTINTMKLIVFSEEQQVVCFLDNTLTPYESCIDFIDQNIGNATRIAVSAQSDKFWVYDQLNSRLHLLSLSQTDQAQKIENVKGILNTNQISELLEYENILYLVDPIKGVYILDMYGSLINFIEKSNIEDIQVELNYIYLLCNGEIIQIDIETLKENKIICPNKGIKEFRKIGSNYYFRSNNIIKKYQLLFKE